MTPEDIDPSPRSYPSWVSLVRRGAFDRSALGSLSISDVETWLLAEASDENDLLGLFQSFVWRLVAAGLPLHRASLHAGTLHPQLHGYACHWNYDDGFCDEVKVDLAVLHTDAYRRNPLFRVIEHGERFRGRPDASDTADQSPLFADLAMLGITEYAAIPLRAVGNYHNATTFATTQAGGFSESQFSEIEDLLRLLALHIQRHIAVRISENVLNTYLGTAAGDQVLQGSIKRGSGAEIEAIIWVSDLRGFTDLADRLDARDMIALLNEYFDRLAGAVIAHGGDVLKFIGDGLLAVFPFSNFDNKQAAADAALNAAESALRALNKLSSDEDQLPNVNGWRPLRSGIALHLGEVFFGNVGAPERLDFTVIGREVNAASRVEGLSKSLGRSILITKPVADMIVRPLDSLGAYELRGLSEPISIFSPKAS